MVRKLIEWGLGNALIVLLLTCALIGVGIHAFVNINVEAYPDPAPAIIEVIAQFPGASAEEVERQVTIPLEVTLAGMPGLKYTRSKSLFGLAHLRNQFEYGFDYDRARQEVINRLQFAQQLPPGVTPQLSPETPTGEIFRYTLRSPKDALGRDIYTLSDLKALQDWVLQREFRRVPRIIDVTSSGGTIKRYEIHPDPDRLKLFGITLQQVQAALTSSNANVGGGYVIQGDVAMNVRSVGLFGGGEDPVLQVLGLKDPDADAAEALRWAEADGATDVPHLREGQRRRLAQAASARLRSEEGSRIREIRSLVITSINNKEILIDDVVEGGRLALGEQAGVRGVVVGHQPRLGRVGLSKPHLVDSPTGIHRVLDPSGKLVWRNEDDKVQCIVLLRKGEDSLPALRDVRKKVEELNQPDSGRLLPGVQIEPYYDRTDLINLTTETVRENLVLGMTLVTVILLMFLSNVRTALIVAINIPLALLFAFAVLYSRGKSANLLSIGAVDFGIIVDSTVIMVENIYRHISSGEYAELPLKERILKACHEVEKPLFFSTAVMVCAFIPLFTMQGPEGQIFGPMADTYAFALGGALLLALLLSPVLCLLLFKNLKPAQDNMLVRWLKIGYLRQLAFFLDHRGLALAFFGGIFAVTIAAMFFLGSEFMPELEEGNLWIRGTFPLNASLDRVAANSSKARAIISSYPEIEAVVPQVGRPDDGTDPTGFYNVEIFVPLRPQKEWPAEVEVEGWRRFLGGKRPRSKEELVKEMNDELNRKIPGVDWNFSQNIRDNVMEALSGVKGDNSVKIIGPDLNELERLAAMLKNKLRTIPGIPRDSVAVFSIKGQTNLEFRVDLEKCKRWGVSAADVNNVIQTALAGKAFSTMIEGEKLFDITIRWPAWRRSSETSILDIPVDISNNQVVMSAAGLNPTASGSGAALPAKTGSLADTSNPLSNTPRLRLRDLISPVGNDGKPDPQGRFERSGASTIYREQGKRLIAVKFSVRGRDLAGAVGDAQEQTKDLVQPPYQMEWSGEFQEMQEAERRLVLVVSLAMALIVILLYLAFQSLLDTVVVLSNVVAALLGGIWSLLLTGTNFNISAAVGFISILGVAIMNGLLMVSAFNAYRSQGVALREAIEKGVGKLIRPVAMTALAAILGLLPAALSTRSGSESQKPLAIAVIGGMLMTLLLANLIPVLYSLYSHREISAEGAGVQSLTH